MQQRTLAIFLDGFERSLAEELMALGEMPAFTTLARSSARFSLDHGSALRTGLAGEHVATGLSPEHSGRAAAVHFDASTYEAWQEGTSRLPFPAGLPLKTVVFDPPYFDLKAASNVAGVVNWGAHDPGVPTGSQPASLLDEVIGRFGAYPATPWIYGLPWASKEQSTAMGEDLAQAVRVRSEITSWMLQERLPDWELALIAVSEAHSAIEGLWHGVDASHPLHGAPSSSAAGRGVRSVYREIDSLVGRLVEQFPDARIVLFSMHGMGPNRSDAASMLLLPELLFRHRYGSALYDRQGNPSSELAGRVGLDDAESWSSWVDAGFLTSPLTQRLHRAPSAMRRRLRRLRGAAGTAGSSSVERLPVSWMPASRYARFWQSMRAFALPSYYDGRVRINLDGRERWGGVPIRQYEAERDAIVKLVRDCRDPVTGDPVVEAVERPSGNPRDYGETDADLIFLWHGAPTGFAHPSHGTIGPVPYRRTGGHTGGYGFAYLFGTAIANGDHGLRSAFDVVPTLLELCGAAANRTLSGRSLLAGLA